MFSRVTGISHNTLYLILGFSKRWVKYISTRNSARSSNIVEQLYIDNWFVRRLSLLPAVILIVSVIYFCLAVTTCDREIQYKRNLRSSFAIFYELYVHSNLFGIFQ